VGDHGSHARHDRFAIADAIGDGAPPSTLGTCPACRALHVDLLTLQRAVRAAWAPRRERDLRLAVADAARLQRGRWRRMLETVGTPRDVLTRPLALSFTGLGLAGLLLTAVPAGLSMGASGVAAPAELHKMSIAAETPLPMAGATDARDESVPADPLPGLSIGLLAIGTSLLAVRRMARHVNGVR
jgi:anti-sigma factor RsiW